MTRESGAGHAIRALLFANLCATAWGQNAVVSGRVTDTSGGVIPNATVELINRATQVKLPTVTNGEGVYIFPSVVPGAYELNARMTGFAALHIDLVTVRGRAGKGTRPDAHAGGRQRVGDRHRYDAAGDNGPGGSRDGGREPVRRQHSDDHAQPAAPGVDDGGGDRDDRAGRRAVGGGQHGQPKPDQLLPHQRGAEPVE